MAKLGDALDAQRGYLFPWAAVLYGTGIALYFSLRIEPSSAVWACIALVFAALVLAAPRVGERTRLIIAGACMVLAGAMAAGVRAHLVAENALGFRYYGPIEGRIVAIDRSSSDAVRLTLDRVVLRDVSPSRTPAKVRVSLHRQQGFFSPEPGLTVIMTGHLSPPGGAVEPGGYDFRRHAWFLRLGAVGYTRTPVLIYAPHDASTTGAGLWIYRLRMKISTAVQSMLPGKAGAFAAAITTGDRAGMDRDTLDDLRASNLAHLLAISGLHMGLLTGFVFAAFRVLLALFPSVIMRVSAKKISAVAALIAGSMYLAMSGGNVATERAFIMVAVMFVALLANRRAVTLRAVAVAALIVLTLRPEVLYGPGFQMSFAATTALVAVYAALRTRPGKSYRWPKWVRFIGGVALSSFVAGLATAPIAAAHFNQVPHYGLIANIVSVPLMGAVIIPAAVLAAVLAPFGIAWIGLAMMEPAILWILGVADTVAHWDGAVSKVVSPQPFVVPLIALGALWMVIWQGRSRLAGGVVLAAALGLWTQAQRPQILVAQSGSLVGVMTPDGRALSKPKGDGFSASSWLENDGDVVDQSGAFGRASFREQGRKRWITHENSVILHATGKVASAEAIALCASVDLVIVNVVAEAPEACKVYDTARLRETGSLALEAAPEGLKVTTARDKSGLRLWSK